MSRTRAQGQVPVARFALSRLLLIASCLSHISVYRISEGGVTSYFWPRPEICQACLLTGRFDQSPAGQEETSRIIIYRFSITNYITTIDYIAVYDYCTNVFWRFVSPQPLHAQQVLEESDLLRKIRNTNRISEWRGSAHSSLHQDL